MKKYETPNIPRASGSPIQYYKVRYRFHLLVPLLQCSLSLSFSFLVLSLFAPLLQSSLSPCSSFLVLSLIAPLLLSPLSPHCASPLVLPLSLLFFSSPLSSLIFNFKGTYLHFQLLIKFFCFCNTYIDICVHDLIF